MAVAGRERADLIAERRLLRRVVCLARCVDGAVPAALLDAVLDGTGSVRPLRVHRLVPAQSGPRPT